MKASAITCAVLAAATLGASGVASAQSYRHDRDGDGGPRAEARQERRAEHRAEARQERRAEHRAEVRQERRAEARADRRGMIAQSPYVYDGRSNGSAEGQSRVPYPALQNAPGYNHYDGNARHGYYSYNNAPRYYGYNNYGPRFYRGGYVPHSYLQPRYYVNNWRAYPALYAPPVGYQWVQVGDDFLLVALATGLIANLRVQ
jgi:Ni/Co efflux regulator RcnB